MQHTASQLLLHMSHILHVRSCFMCALAAMQHTASAHLLQVRIYCTYRLFCMFAHASRAHLLQCSIQQVSFYCTYRILCMFAHASSTHLLQCSMRQVRIYCIYHIFCTSALLQMQMHCRTSNLQTKESNRQCWMLQSKVAVLTANRSIRSLITLWFSVLDAANIQISTLLVKSGAVSNNKVYGADKCCSGSGLGYGVRLETCAAFVMFSARLCVLMHLLSTYRPWAKN